MTVEEQIERLSGSVEAFARCIRALPAEAFLEKIDEWAPRDMVAHLIGWNRYTVEGAEQMRRGQVPLDLIDDQDDFRAVNAASVRRYASLDRRELLDELEASLEELKGYLRSLEPNEWAGCSVRHAGWTITIENTVQGLTGDYDHHRQQLEAWAGRRGRTG